MKKYFHVFNFYAFSFSILLYLLNSSINTKAAEWGLSYMVIGLINFIGCVFYVISALVTRSQWDALDFSRVAAIDPAATLNACGALVRLDRSARFVEVTPMDMSVLN